MQLLAHWEYALKSGQPSELSKDALIVKTAKANNRFLKMEWIGLAENRNGEMISCAMHLQQFTNDFRLDRRFGEVVLIPVGNLDPYEGFTRVLRDVLEIS